MDERPEETAAALGTLSGPIAQALSLLQDIRAGVRALASDGPGNSPEQPLGGVCAKESAAAPGLLTPLRREEQAGPAALFDAPLYKLLFQSLRNSQADYKTAVTFIQYESDLKQKLLEFRTEEDSYLLLTGLKFNYLLLKNFYAVFQVYVNDEPLMNPDGYKVLSPFSVTDRIPFNKVVDPGSRVEVFVTLKEFETNLIPDFFALLDALSQAGGTALGEDTNTYVLLQSGPLPAGTRDWFSQEVLFENLGEYTLHVEADLAGGSNYQARVFWEWLEPAGLAPVELPLDQSPVILSVTRKNARGRLHYVVSFTGGGNPQAPDVADIRLVQTFAKMSLDWGDLTVINTLLRGVKLPRDVFQNFGEAL